jgi:hypothetical protein
MKLKYDCVGAKTPGENDGANHAITLWKTAARSFQKLTLSGLLSMRSIESFSTTISRRIWQTIVRAVRDSIFSPRQVIIIHLHSFYVFIS